MSWAPSASASTASTGSDRRRTVRHLAPRGTSAHHAGQGDVEPPAVVVLELGDPLVAQPGGVEGLGHVDPPGVDGDDGGAEGGGPLEGERRRRGSLADEPSTATTIGASAATSKSRSTTTTGQDAWAATCAEVEPSRSLTQRGLPVTTDDDELGLPEASTRNAGGGADHRLGDDARSGAEGGHPLARLRRRSSRSKSSGHGVVSGRSPAAVGLEHPAGDEHVSGTAEPLRPLATAHSRAASPGRRTVVADDDGAGGAVGAHGSSCAAKGLVLRAWRERAQPATGPLVPVSAGPLASAAAPCLAM